jgi:hypothetical protein
MIVYSYLVYDDELARFRNREQVRKVKVEYVSAEEYDQLVIKARSSKRYRFIQDEIGDCIMLRADPDNEWTHIVCR